MIENRCDWYALVTSQTRVLLLMLASSAAPARAQEWVSVNAANGSTPVWTDLDSVVTTETTADLWIKSRVTAGPAAGGELWQRIAINCADRSVAVRSGVLYDAKMDVVRSTFCDPEINRLYRQP